MKAAIEKLQKEYDYAKSSAESTWGGDQEESRVLGAEFAEALTALGVPTNPPLFVWQSKLVKQEGALTEKIEKEKAFHSGEKFPTMPEAEKVAMIDQLNALEAYAATVRARIALF